MQKKIKAMLKYLFNFLHIRFFLQIMHIFICSIFLSIFFLFLNIEDRTIIYNKHLYNFFNIQSIFL